VEEDATALSVLTVIGVVTAVGLAAVVTSIAGFGFALLSVPLLAVVLDAKQAVAVASLLSVLSTGVLLARFHDHVQWPTAGRQLGAAVLGMPLGLYVLVTADEDVLRVVIAVMVLLATGLIASGIRIRRAGRSIDVGAGFLSGVLNASIGTNGPPIVLALQSRGLEPEPFRATVAVVFTASNLLTVGLLALAGRYTAEVLAVSAMGLPTSVLGWWVGARLARRIPAERFRGIVLGLLVFAAVLALGSVAFA
jgi:uncharacterized membrane protein YfcA